MSYCQKCGNELEDGASFCTKCGTPVNENVSSENSTYAKSNINTEQMGNFLSDAGSLLKNIIIKPVSTVQTIYKTTKFEVSISLLVLMSLIYGLFNVLMLKHIAGKITSLFSSMLGGFLSGGLSSASTGLPYGKIFFMSLFIFILFVVMIYALILACTKIFYGTITINPKNMLNIAIISFIPFICGYILFGIFAYLSFTIGFIFLLFGNIMTIICLYRGYCAEINISENSMLFFISACYVITCLINTLITNAFLKSLLSIPRF